MDEALPVLGVGRKGASGSLLEALDDSGLACAILAHDQRQRLAKVDWNLIVRVEAANSLD